LTYRSILIFGPDIANMTGYYRNDIRYCQYGNMKRPILLILIPKSCIRCHYWYWDIWSWKKV